MEDLKKLYDVLVRDGYYTKSYEEFVQQYGGSDEYREKVFSVVSRDGIYTKSREEFFQKYQSPQTEDVTFTEEEEVKKKDTTDERRRDGLDMELPSEDGSLVSQETEVVETEYQPALQAEEVFIDGFDVVGRDTRATDYVDPTTGMLDPMFSVAPGAPGAMGRPLTKAEKYNLAQAQAQKKADLEYTKKLIEAEAPALAELQKQEAKKRKQRQQELQAETDEIVGSNSFNAALSSTTTDAIKMEEDEAVPYFTNLYGDYGFTFRRIGLGDAMEVSAVGPDGKARTVEIDLDPFTETVAVRETAKLKDFVTKYAKRPEDLREEIAADDIQSAMKARKLRPKGRLNPDGTTSTVLFESAEIDGKNVVYPTLFLKNENLIHENPEYWMELDGDAAYKMALERGEVFNFETPEEAEAFAKGSWKGVSNADAEADKFFKDRGYDYLSYKRQFEEYEDARDAVDFIEKRIFTIDELTPEEKEKYRSFYDPNTGQLRNDINDIKQTLEAKEEELFPLYSDDDFQALRDDFDVYMDEQYQQLARDAAQTNASSKVVTDLLEKQSEDVFGMSIEELLKYEPKDDTEMAQKNAILTSYEDAKAVSQLAADKYMVAETFLDAKYDENLRGEIADNWAGISNSWNEGWYRGKAGNEILKMSLGLVDMDDEATTAQIARDIVDYMEASNTGITSRALNRYYSAKGFREAWDAFSDNPAELALAMAANSFSQMAPYGMKIIGMSTAAGTATGAGIGASGFVTGPGGVLTTAGGAAAGFGYGLRSGFAATNVALEYTNEWFAAAEQMGFDTRNPEKLVEAFDDPEVWAVAKERGLKRGLTIGVIDFLSSGLAGRLFTTGKTASLGSRIALQTAERFTFDPLSEMTGEILAQAAVGDELDWKEVFAEGLGSVGSNSSMMAVNMALDMRAKNNVDIANRLTTIEGLNKELKGAFAPSEKRVSAWANNMQRIGQINQETNQRIQENIGLRRDANNVLDATSNQQIGSRKTSAVVQRTMELMAAKEELSSTQNRKEVFKDKIADINAELQELVETKQLRTTDAQVNLDNIVGTYQQTTSTDVRPDVQASYSIDGKTMNRRKFLDRISDMSAKQFKKSKIRVVNDETATNVVTDKFGTDAIQEQETGGISPTEQTGDIQTVEGEVRDVQQEQTTEPTTTTEATEVTEEVTVPEPVKATRADVKAFDENTMEQTRLDGLLSAIADKVLGNKKLTKFQEKLNEANSGRVEEIVSLKTQQQETAVAVEQEAADLEAVLQEGRGRIEFDEEVETDEEVVTTEVTPTEQVTEEAAPVEVAPTEEETQLLSDVEQFDMEIEDLENEIVTEKQNLKDDLAEVDAKIKEVRASKKNRETKAELIADLQGQKQDLKDENKGLIDSYKEDMKLLKSDQRKAQRRIKKLQEQRQPRVDFRLKEETETTVRKEGAGRVEDVVEAMNANEEGAVVTMEAVEETQPDSPKIDINELNSRTDNPVPTIEWKVIDGVPVIFNISDQLRTGDIVNPATGNTITNLKGGLGFVGVKGHENIAWASVTEDKVKAQISSAIDVYRNNKQFFDTWWKNNPQYDGLVPMVITKMESSSILSNEAVVRVLADNLTAFPKKNKVEALKLFKDRIKQKREAAQRLVDTGKTQKGKDATKSTIKQSETLIEKIKDVESMMEKLKVKSIDGLLTPEALKALKGITSVNIITENIAYGKPNSPSAKKVTPGKPNTPVAKALLGDNPSLEERSKLHLGAITDVITEPQLVNTPIRSAFMITGVDVINPSIEKTTHPNYPVGPRGKVMGVIEQPQSIVELFPAAYNNIVLGMEQEARGERKARTAKSRLMQTVPVQMGLNNTEFIGSRFGIDNVGRFLDFINRSMPFVTISTDQDTMNRLLMSDSITPYLKEGQVVYGMTQDGKIFINAEVHNSQNELFNTAIHEMGHIWTETLKLTPKGKKLYARGAELVKQTKTYEKFLKKFDGDIDKAVDETMATLIGNKGETVVAASLKQQIKDWIAAVWSYVKDTFKLSKDLTVDEIQDLTLDEFLGTALADIFKGKPIKMSDKQLKTLTAQMAESLFRTDESMEEVIRVGRNNGYSDASIRFVLQGRGFRAADIDAAMEFNISENLEIPPEFSRVEGGIERATQMLIDINQKLDRFAGKRRRSKPNAEIRQKAQDLLKAHPLYKEQTEQVQMELRFAIDRTLGYTENRNVSREMARIKAALRERKVGVRNLKKAQLALRNYIRANLPKSKSYTQAQINSLIKAVAEMDTPEKFEKQKEKIIKIVDKQRAKIKRETIAEITKIVKTKATARKQSGKPRAKGIDALGQVKFANIQTVLKALQIVDPTKREQALQDIADKLDANRPDIEEAYQRMVNNEELTTAQENLVQLQAAYDQFADINNMTLEEVQQLLEQVKQIKKESILRFNARRLQKLADAKIIADQATEQIQETNPDLFYEDGTLKGTNELNEDKDAIQKDFRDRGIMKKVFMKIGNAIFGRTENNIITKFKNSLTHLGTVTNFLDRSGKGLSIFTDRVYRALNRMDEIALQNKRAMRQKVDEIAQSVGIEKGFEGVEAMVNKALGTKRNGVPKTKTLNLINTKTEKKYSASFNANQLLRIYALSKNSVQRTKLEKQGITDSVLEEIANDLGPELTGFADKMVEYLSTTYFDEVNSVYKQANDVSLGFVENYFPTKTVRAKVDAKLLENGDFNGIFSAETAPAFKDRTDYGSDVNLKEGTFTGVLMNHMETMEKYKAYALGVQQLNQFFSIPAVDALLDLSGTKNLIKTLVNASVNPQSAAKAGGLESGLLEWFQRKFTSFALAFKVVQIAKQATSFVNAFSQYNYFKPNSKVPKLLQGPIDLVMFTLDAAGVLFSMAPDLVGRNGAIAKAREMSATFDQRIREGLEGDVYGLESGSQTFKQAGKGTSMYQTAKRNFKSASARPTIIGDVMGVMGYYINYKRNIANGMSEAQALEEFNDYNATQQTRRNTEKIPLQLTGNGFAKGFTMFGSTLFLQMNKVMQSSTNIARAIGESIALFGKGEIRKAIAARPSKKDVRDFYLNYAVANMLFVGVSNLALLTKGDDDDRDAFMRKIKDAMIGLNLMYQIPYLGAAIEKGWNEYRGDRKPVDDVTNVFTSIYSKMNKNIKKNPDNAFKAYVVPLIELALGAQVDPFIGLYNAIEEGVFGDPSSEEFYDNMYDALGITPSYRPGYGQKKNELKGKIPQGGIKTKTELKRYDPDLYEKKYGKKDELKKKQKEKRKEMLRRRGYVERNGKLYKIK